MFLECVILSGMIDFYSKSNLLLHLLLLLLLLILLLLLLLLLLLSSLLLHLSGKLEETSEIDPVY